jgi:flagellar FliJ protein
LQSIDVRRKNIKNTMTDLERERAREQDDLAAAFQDLKSFELAEEERLRRAADAEAHSVQSRLDEMAIVRHLRKHAIRR